MARILCADGAAPQLLRRQGIGDGPILQPKDLPAELLDAALGAAPTGGEHLTGGARSEQPLSAEATRLVDALRRTGGN